MKELKFEMPSMEWTVYQDKTFCVTVKNWKRKKADWIGSKVVISDEPANYWNVYAFIYEDHPAFNKPGLISNLHFHGGITYDRTLTEQTVLGIGWPKDEPRVTIKVGSDYAHYGDEYYENEDGNDGVPWSIQNDCGLLVEQLLEMKESEY